MNDYLNDVPLSERPKPVRGGFYDWELHPHVVPGGTRSVPRGTDSAAGRLNYSRPNEHPVESGTAGVTFETATEPESPPTLEPASPV